MKHLIILLGITILFPIICVAQELKVINIKPMDKSDWTEAFPTDLNGNICSLVEVALTNESVTFEGNIIGTPVYEKGVYFVFVTPNTKNLNVKYPAEKPLMITFSDYNIPSLSPESIFRIEMKEPSSDVTEQLDSNMVEISPEAQELYEKGSDSLSKNDYVNAFDYFTKAYELGHMKAAYYLGFIYSDPYHSVRKNKLLRNFANDIAPIPDTPVEQDLDKAFSYYKESAEAGFVTAQYAVGECLEKGSGTKKNKEEALIWYEKAAEQGHLQAQEKIGGKIKKNRMMGIVTSYGSSDNVFILNGMESDANDLSAVSNPRKDKNDEVCALVKVLLPFENVSISADTVGNPIFKTNEYWVYLPQGAKEMTIGYTDFEPLKINFKNLGINNIASKTTYKLSISFPIDLLKDDSSISAENLYKIGLGYMERRDNQYIRWMTKAADKGYPMAQYQLGSCYLYGNGVKKDKEKGVSLLESASEQGVGEASYYLGQYYEFFSKDKKKAQTWYDKAVSQGYDAAKGKKAKNRKIYGIF